MFAYSQFDRLLISKLQLLMLGSNQFEGNQEREARASAKCDNRNQTIKQFSQNVETTKADSTHVRRYTQISEMFICFAL